MAAVHVRHQRDAWPDSGTLRQPLLDRHAASVPVPARRAVHRAGRAPVRAEPERAVRPAAGRNRPDDDRAQRDGQRVGELLFDPERVLEHRRASQGDPPSRETVLRALSAADPRRAGPADRAAVRVPHPAVRHPKQGGDADDVDPVDNHHRCLPDRGRIHAGPVRAAAGRQRHERGRVPRRRAAWIHAPAPDVPHVRRHAAVSKAARDDGDAGAAGDGDIGELGELDGLDWPAQPISGNDDAEGGNNGNEESAGETTEQIPPAGQMPFAEQEDETR